jgi:Flp pilus assembly protein TadD
MGLWGLTLLEGCTSQKPVSVARVDGYLAMRAGDLDTARQEFAYCVGRDATDWKSHYYLAAVLLDQNADVSGARRHLEVANEIREQRPGTAFKPRFETQETVVPYPTRGQILDELAEAMFREDNPEQLFTFLRDVSDRYGETTDYMRMARYLHKSGDHDSALVTYQKAIKVADEDDTSPHIALAGFYDSVGARRDALIQLRIAYGIDPDNPAIADAIRAHGMVPGPTVALPRQ